MKVFYCSVFRRRQRAALWCWVGIACWPLLLSAQTNPDSATAITISADPNSAEPAASEPSPAEPGPAEPGQASLSLDQAIAAAIGNDPWLVSNSHRQAAMEATSIASGTLPDPRLGVSFANLPTNSFNFNQEPMTQFKLDLSQSFPRGNSLALEQRRLAGLAEQYPWQRQNRGAQVSAQVSQLWLDGFRAQTTIALINRDRGLFEQLVDVAQAGYSTAANRTRQQDIIRAQLELTRLDDRLTLLRQQHDNSIERLGEWLGAELLQDDFTNPLPQLALTDARVLTNSAVNTTALNRALLQHPMIRTLNKQIDAANTGVDLAKQDYKPQWNLSASYGYRDEDPNGIDRADFFSIGVNVDLPLFTANKQDKKVSAAISTTEAIKTDKALMLREMSSKVKTLFSAWQRLQQRQQLYRQQLLPQIHEQAEASLTAYTNDDGDFAEVMRAHIAELNANIDALAIDVDIQKHIAQLNYFLVGSGQ